MKTHTTYLGHFLMLFALCFSASLMAQPSASTALARAAILGGKTVDIGPPPTFADGPLAQDTLKALDVLFSDFGQTPWDNDKSAALDVIADSGDVRLAWVVTDLMRFVSSPELNDQIAEALNELLGTRLRGSGSWNASVSRLIAWDIPAPPGYLTHKRAIYTGVFPEWKPLFVEGNIDWRHVSWGGVRIDARPFNKTDESCNCIPAADNPEVSTAQEADWLADDAVVFGISINGEHRAYPRRIMEVREMVNDTLGGRDLGIAYCTLCGSAQAWFTDELPEGVERPVLRTSGLLIRSNKVMYDLTTQSVMDTFLGTAVTGPLAKRGLQLEQASVITTTWGAWKAEFPDTTVLVERLALGRDFDFRNGRDASGPIFPIGNVDERLGIQEDVLGVVTQSGKPIAFHVPSLIKALDAGQTVTVDGVHVILSGGGVRAVDNQGQDLGTHQAFWFAWSQFHKDTALWPER
ncbi:MAG: DUF3179 domain-containing (seleno)protein [Lysobacterales bacterium]